MQANPVKYSFSRISTFEQCARRFRYRYLDGIKEGFRGVEAFMGQQVHATVEWLYNERDAGRVRPLEEAVKYYCDTWDAETGKSRARIRVINRNQSLIDYHRTGAEMISRFYGERFILDKLETLANEKHFVVRVGGAHTVQGFIDRLARDEDGGLHIIDYKTGKQRNRTFSGKDADQLRTYGLAMFAETDAEEVNLHLEYLRTGERLSARMQRRDADAVDAVLASKITNVESSTVFPPTPGMLCNWCGYNDLCEASGVGPQRPYEFS